VLLADLQSLDDLYIVRVSKLVAFHKLIRHITFREYSKALEIAMALESDHSRTSACFPLIKQLLISQVLAHLVVDPPDSVPARTCFQKLIRICGQKEDADVVQLGMLCDDADLGKPLG